MPTAGQPRAAGEGREVSAAECLDFFRLRVIADNRTDDACCGPFSSRYHSRHGVRRDYGVIVEQPDISGIASLGNVLECRVVAVAKAKIGAGVDEYEARRGNFGGRLLLIERKSRKGNSLRHRWRGVASHRRIRR